ncbi:MAG TPA: SAM-dependent chlorinase/fluorinase [Acidimicrobiales bacterium]|nr:SAM-dependent chlorinase/fluorinase [Acidimicrobiales bacterium]
MADPPTYDTVSFLSDFGTEDEFAGVVRSVITSLAPQVRVIDLTHGIPAHDVRAGGLALARAVQYLVPGVVLAVVDPGVGTDRRAVAVEAPEAGSVFVGPDNGLLASAVAMAGGGSRAVSLTETSFHLPAPGATFAGRDVFAPVAAHLCNGVPLDELGSEVDPAGLRPGVLPVARTEAAGLVAEVLWVDRFGNLQLNVGPEEIEAYGDPLLISFAGTTRSARRVQAYGEIGPGALGLVVDAYGLVSLCLERQSAAAELGLGTGASVTLAAAGERSTGDGAGASSPATPVNLGPTRSAPDGRGAP